MTDGMAFVGGVTVTEVVRTGCDTDARRIRLRNVRVGQSSLEEGEPAALKIKRNHGAGEQVVREGGIDDGTALRNGSWSFLIVTIMGMVVMGAVLTKSEWSSRILDVSEQFGRGRTAMLLFLIQFIANMIPLGSTSNFVTLTGFLFGSWHGFLISFAAKYGAAMTVFFLGRTWLKPYVRERLQTYPNAEKILEAAEMEGWPVMVALRISPVPTVFVNYMLSVANVSTVSYALATAAGVVPLLIRALLVGAAARQISEASAHAMGKKELFLFLGIAVFLTVVIGKVASRAKKLMDEVGISPATKEKDVHRA